MHPAIPITDAEEFYRLPKPLQQDLLDRLAVMTEMEGVTGTGSVNAVAIAHHDPLRRGFSRKSHWRHWQAWKTNRDWHSLIDNAKVPTAADKIELADDAERREFIEFVAG
jgi:hypothetical protein